MNVFRKKIPLEGRFFIWQILISGLLFFLLTKIAAYETLSTTIFFTFCVCTVTSTILLSLICRPIKKIERALQSYHKICSPSSKEILNRVAKSSDRTSEIAKAIEFLTSQIVSHHKTSTNTKEERKVIIESLLEGIIIIDQQMYVRDLNQAALRFFQLSKNECITVPLEKLPVKKNSSLLDSCRRLLTIAFKEMRAVRDIYSFDDSPNNTVELIVVPKAYRDGAIIVLQDKASNRNSEEVGKDFVANASHELRTPITIIRGFAETLQDFPDLSKEMFQEIIGKINRNCLRMEKLVQNLLTLADVGHLPESRFRECDIFQLFSRTRETILAIYPQTIFSMSCDEPSSLFADVDLLELAITNLLDNAAKYSPQPARIELEIKRKKADILISIKDYGIGIPQSDLTFIFDRFYTVDKTHSRKLGGAGLGLSLVKTIIEKHHGTISVASKLGKGTIFTILLPIKRESISKVLASV